ncbi:hypothetical protein [Shewanella acanthi]|uniref:hypothetical protein n=1 Tax=Shewanella acanthi TaxID=2864212 RepID=UPI001C65B925|nr:hypothetical protein [Shewanella acanthi]QYJ78445.1 hypothetical protein K0H61_15305 [Shewanella acanthi]
MLNVCVIATFLLFANSLDDIDKKVLVNDVLSKAGGAKAVFSGEPDSKKWSKERGDEAWE